ncbi:hypothetical protein Tco_1508796 [Tanacetum coccineum]
MSRDVITVGSTMRIPLLYRGEYSQWRERFMNYLEEQTDGEAMINSIQNGDHPLPVIAQVSLAGTAPNAPPTLKDPQFWTAEEKKNRKIDRLARSLLIQGLPNDIYSLIDSNDTAKDLWDALERQMRGSEYGEQDRKAAILYEYETFKATKGEQFAYNYLQYLHVNNEFDENLMDINIDALYNILKQNQGDVNDAMGYKKKAIVVTSDPLALVAEKTKVSKRKEKVVVQSESEEKKEDRKSMRKKWDMSKLSAIIAEGRKFCQRRKESKVNEYNYYKTKMLLVERSDEQVLLAEDQAWMEYNSEESSSSAEETIAEVSYYTSDFESESEYETLEYYDNSTNYGLFMNNDDDQEIFHDAIESASENFNENHIVSQTDHDQSEVDHNDSEDKDHLVDKLIKRFNHKIAKCQKRIEKTNQQSKDLENQNKDLQDKYDVLKNQVNTFEEKNNEFNEQIKVLNETNVDLLAQTEVLQEQLKVKHVVIDTHTECQAQYAKLEEERYQYMIRYSALCDNDKQHRKKIDEQEILFDKMSRQLVEMNNNVLRLQEKILEKETKILELEECVRNKDLEIEKCLERLNDCENKLHKIGQTSQTIHMIMPSKDKMNVVEKGIGFENPVIFCKAKDLRPSLYDERVIGLGYMSFFSFEMKLWKLRNLKEQERIKLNFEKIDSPFQQTSSLKPYVPTVILEKIIIDLEDEVKKGPSNTSSVDLSFVSISKLNKDVKRYSRKDLLSCNNSYHVDTRSAYACNDTMNVSCNSRLHASYDVNDLFVFDDVSIRNSRVSKIPFRKEPRDSLNVHSKSNSNNSLPRTLFRWLPKMQPSAEPVAKWIPKICLWIIDSGCSKNMMGKCALLINFMEKFIGTVRFGNNDFAVIVGYGDVVIGSITIKKVYYVEGLGHNLFSVGQFCDKGHEVAFRKSTCFVRNEDGVDLLTGDRSSNLYTIALNEIASNSST